MPRTFFQFAGGRSCCTLRRRQGAHRSFQIVIPTDNLTIGIECDEIPVTVLNAADEFAAV
jgi:hypothetical protein